jgi:cytochrome b subunit of formate dehydrogenase
MYCPVCGDEYREGVTHCPEHGVELVDEPPELEEAVPLLQRFNDRTAVRIPFITLLVAGVVYAVSGLVTSTLSVLIFVREWDAATAAQIAQGVQSGAFAVAVGAMGALSGAVLLRAYLAIAKADEREAPVASDPGEEDVRKSPIGSALMRLLFALMIVFTLLWVATGIITSTELAELTAAPFAAFERGEPEDSLVTLFALNHAAYSGGIACLAIMGAALIVRGHERLRSRVPT